MYKGNSSRIIPIILVLIVIAIAIAALVSVGRAIFGGNQQATQTDAGRTSLLNTSSNHSVRMTVRGPLVANEDFRSYQITVDPSSRSLVTYKGYLDQVINSENDSNNLKAYEQFVYALDKADMMSGTPLTGAKNDTRGICATGEVYQFEVLEDNQSVKSLWTSTCKGSSGSFKASVAQVQELFLDQVPNNKSLIDKLNLGSNQLSLL